MLRFCFASLIFGNTSAFRPKILIFNFNINCSISQYRVVEWYNASYQKWNFWELSKFRLSGGEILLAEEEIKELLDELKRAENEVLELRKKLNKINHDKENLYKKRESLSNEIKAKIGELSGSKEKRNVLTKEVKEKKQQRDVLNAQITKEVAVIKTLKEEYEKIMKEKGLKSDPSELRKQIEGIEFKIQTEPMSFDKEQKLMKNIKDLRKKYNEVKVLAEKTNEIKVKSKEIDELKKKANALHKEVQQEAAQSQTFHEALISEYKGIDEFRKEEQEFQDKFEEYKNEFNLVNEELKKKLEVLREVKSKLEENKIEFQESVKEHEKKSLEEKKKEIDEKMSTGMKLTTEDILVLQRLEQGGR